MKIPAVHGCEVNEWLLVDHLEVESLLAERKWLCPRRMTQLGKTAFGDLFLRDKARVVFWLNTAAGKLTQIAKSEAQFRALAESNERRREWFAEPDQEAWARRGLNPSPSQCIGFSVPLVFAEGGSSGTAYYCRPL
jgi:hypothetical protein